MKMNTQKPGSKTASGIAKNPNIKIDVKVQNEQVEVDCRAYQLTKYQNQGKYCRAKPDHNNARCLMLKSQRSNAKNRTGQSQKAMVFLACTVQGEHKKAQVTSARGECRGLQWPLRFTAGQHRAPC